MLNSLTPRYDPIGYCIYCGTTEGSLSDEHIMPYALSGRAFLPKASCESCAQITKKFEQTVARSMYGPFRIKQGYPTRRKKERPEILDVYTDDVEKSKVEVPISDYPNTYIAVELPPPGLLLGVEPSNLNPEMKFSFRGDLESVNKAMDSLSLDQIIIQHNFDWGAFFKQLAKIGHCYAFACTQGKKYVPLLPDIILGKSQHLSYYVGGASKDSLSVSEGMPSGDLSLYAVENNSKCYLVAGVELFGVGTLHPYEVVVGYIPDFIEFLSSTASNKEVKT